MAGTVMHLVIADRLLPKLNISNPSLFFCGNLAPDAIMGRQNYTREMKTHTHFKDGQKPFEFRIPENQKVYMERLMDFANTFLSSEYADMRDFYVGYLTHMLVDELYLSVYYEQFLVELEEKGISPEDETFCKGFVHDVDHVDWELVRTYAFSKPMPDILFESSGYEVPGWIYPQELEGSKQYIVFKNFRQEHAKEPLAVTTYERNWEYMDVCVDRIPGMLKERFGIE